MPKAASIDAYLASITSDKRAALEKLRRAVKAAAPRAEECISYQLRVPVAEHAAELASYKTSKGTIRFPSDEPLPAPESA